MRHRTGQDSAECPRRLDEVGAMAVEVAVLLPAIMLLMFLGIQAALWAHAHDVVEASATAGEAAAQLQGATPAYGYAEAERVIASEGSGLIQGAQVEVQLLPGDLVQVTVTGRAQSIVPWLDLTVRAVRIGPEQEFRISG